MQRQDRVLIVLNGGRIPPNFLASWVAAADHVIAADGGANALADAGLEPHTVLGDLDSIRPDLQNFLQSATFLPDPDQNSTDFQKSLRFATQELKATEIAILGAEGDRVDHLLSAFSVAAKHAADSNIRFVFEMMTCHIVTTAKTFSVEPNAIVSLIPVPTARVTATGLEFPVENLPLAFAQNDGVSNRATAGEIQIAVHDGVVAVFIERESGEPDW